MFLRRGGISAKVTPALATKGERTSAPGLRRAFVIPDRQPTLSKNPRRRTLGPAEIVAWADD
jgi:hypothetical protein